MRTSLFFCVVALVAMCTLTAAMDPEKTGGGGGGGGGSERRRPKYERTNAQIGFPQMMLPPKRNTNTRKALGDNTFKPLEQEAREKEQKEKVEKHKSKLFALKGAINEILVTERVVAGTVDYGCKLLKFKPLGVLLNKQPRSNTEPTEIQQPAEDLQDKSSKKSSKKGSKKSSKKLSRKEKKAGHMSVQEPLVLEQPKTKSGKEAPEVVKSALQIMCDLQQNENQFLNGLEQALQNVKTTDDPQELAEMTVTVDKLIIAYLKQNMKLFVQSSELNLEYSELVSKNSPKLKELIGVVQIKYEQDKLNGRLPPNAQFDLQSLMMVLVQRIMRYSLQVDAINDYFHPAHTKEQEQQQLRIADEKGIEAKVKKQAFFHVHIKQETWKELFALYKQIQVLGRKPNSKNPYEQQIDQPTPTKHTPEDTPTQIAEDTPPTQSDPTLSIPPLQPSATPKKRRHTTSDIDDLRKSDSSGGERDDTDADEDETDDESDGDEDEEDEAM